MFISLGSFQEGKSDIGCLECLLREVAGIVPTTTIGETAAVVISIEVGMAGIVNTLHLTTASLTEDIIQDAPC